MNSMTFGSRLILICVVFFTSQLLGQDKCLNSFRNYALEHFQNDLQVYVNHKVLNSNTSERPLTLTFTALDRKNEVLVHVKKPFVETELAVINYLESRSINYEVLEFHGRYVFHIKNIRGN
jgi:hypothetical protein